jgi:mannose-6-phosphate isomerase
MAKNRSVNLVQCPYFQTNIIDLYLPVLKDYSELDSFVIFICTEGAAEIVYPGGKESITRGEVMLIPAVIDKVALAPLPSCRILEVCNV